MEDISISVFQNFTNDFICFKCKKKSTKPKIMPCCGKIGCESCIQDILTNNSSCPNCNEPILKHSLSPVHVHLIDSIEEYSNILEQICSESNICKKHNKQIEYYCKDCNKPLCADCIFDELLSEHPLHKDHNIVNIKMKLQNDISLLNSIIDSIEKDSSSILKILAKLEKSNNSILLELHSLFRDMCKSIDSKKALAVKPIDNIIKQLNELKDQLYKSLRLVKKLIVTQNSKVITELPRIIEEAKTIDQKYQQLEPILPELNISNDISPQYQCFNFDIPNFSEIQKKYSQLEEDEDKFILSEKKTINGNKWRAKVYPNGNAKDKNGYLSAFVELIRGNKTPSVYFYRVEIVSNDPCKPNIVKEYNSEFKINDSWGWNKVASLDTILNQEGYLDENGTLKLIFGIHAETYYQVYKDLQEAAKYEYTKIKKLKKKSEKK